MMYPQSNHFLVVQTKIKTFNFFNQVSDNLGIVLGILLKHHTFYTNPNKNWKFHHTYVYCFIFQLKDEILSSYQQIKTLCSQLRQRPRRNSNDSNETSSSSEEVIHSDSLKKGKYKYLLNRDISTSDFQNKRDICSHAS